MITIVAPKLTYQDLVEMPSDGKRYELIDGEVYAMTPSPNREHQRAVGELYLLLRLYAEKTDAGEVLLAPFDVVLDQRNVCQPDLLFIKKERSSVVTAANVSGAPDLVIEVLSPGTAKFDRETKFQVYARNGVSELWFVDTDRETIEVFQQIGDGRLGLTQTAARDEAVISAVLTGIPLTPRKVFS